MEKESTVDFFAFCAYCDNEYIDTIIIKDSNDWGILVSKLGKKLGWCGKCSLITE